MFYKEDNFSVFLFALLVHQIPSEEESTLKVKNLLPREANSFCIELFKRTPFRVDLFSEGS